MTFIPIYTFFSYVNHLSILKCFTSVGQERRSWPMKIYYFLQKKTKHCCWQRDDCLAVSSVRQLEYIAESINYNTCVSLSTAKNIFGFCFTRRAKKNSVISFLWLELWSCVGEVYERVIKISHDSMQQGV